MLFKHEELTISKTRLHYRWTNRETGKTDVLIAQKRLVKHCWKIDRKTCFLLVATRIQKKKDSTYRTYNINSNTRRYRAPGTLYRYARKHATHDCVIRLGVICVPTLVAASGWPKCSKRDPFIARSTWPHAPCCTVIPFMLSWILGESCSIRDCEDF